ncbi:MAG: hypothetical protein KAH84_09475 [Thiomargarita sp.]|nr:hypothetical protein [Thiomargarita sp.]
MLNLQLDVQPQTAKRLQKILAYIPNQESFVQDMIAFQISELRKAILAIRLDLQKYESIYQLETTQFYVQFQQGTLDDTKDFILWAGLYEMLQSNTIKLQELT